MRTSWLSVIIATGVTAIAAAASLPGAAPQVPTLAQDSITGSDSFQFYCASCHGSSGKGDGPTSAVLKTRPADLTTLARRNGGAFPTDRVADVVNGTGRQVTAHGPPDMPLWGPIFRALDSSDARARQRIANIVAHVEKLQEPTSAAGDMGARLFATHCATCHGSTARGNGPLAASLRNTPPDLTKFTTRNGGVFPSERVRRIIDGRDVASHGDRTMPVWGNAFTISKDGLTEAEVKARIDAITRYLQAIQERAAE